MQLFTTNPLSRLNKTTIDTDIDKRNSILQSNYRTIDIKVPLQDSTNLSYTVGMGKSKLSYPHITKDFVLSHLYHRTLKNYPIKNLKRY